MIHPRSHSKSVELLGRAPGLLAHPAFLASRSVGPGNDSTGCTWELARSTETRAEAKPPESETAF